MVLAAERSGGGGQGAAGCALDDARTGAVREASPGTISSRRASTNAVFQGRLLKLGGGRVRHRCPLKPKACGTSPTSHMVSFAETNLMPLRLTMTTPSTGNSFSGPKSDSAGAAAGAGDVDDAGCNDNLVEDDVEVEDEEGAGVEIVSEVEVGIVGDG